MFWSRYGETSPHRNPRLGGRPTVGHVALDHGIGVRIPASQPIPVSHDKRLFGRILRLFRTRVLRRIDGEARRAPPQTKPPRDFRRLDFGSNPKEVWPVISGDTNYSEAVIALAKGRRHARP